MGKIFAVPTASSAQTGAISFVEVRARSGGGLRLVELRISQSTEVGDAQEEMIRWNFLIGTGTVTSGSGGTSPTPYAIDGTGASSSFTAEVNNTTRLAVGTGTLTTIAMDPFNVRTGLLYIPTPEVQWMIFNQNYIDIGMATAPVDSITWEGVSFWEEL